MAKDAEAKAMDDTDESKAKAKPKEEVVSKAKFDELLERFNHQQATLDAINGTIGKIDERGKQAAARPQGNDNLRSYAKVIADEMGWDHDATYANTQLIDRIITEVGRHQVFPVLNALADRIDGIEARQQFPDYTKFAGDIDKEREAKAAQGQYLTRSEAYHLVRGRKLPEIVEEERAKLAAEHATSDTTSDGLSGTQAKVGPSGGTSGLPNPDDLARMSTEERQALLDRLGNF